MAKCARTGDVLISGLGELHGQPERAFSEEGKEMGPYSK